ncbi:MAG: hypothetical protein ACYDBQ_05600 [Thermoplasmatota archaeon]
MSDVAVVVCSGCRAPWAVELRHREAHCPSCRRACDLTTHVLEWRGSSLQEAQQEVARRRGPAPAPREARHDSTLDRAAAAGRRTVNHSRRAEAVAAALLAEGEQPHGELVMTLTAAGLDRARAEREVSRMLACDYLTEPRAGRYRLL